MATATDLGDPGCSAGVPPCMGSIGDNGLAAGHPRIKVPVGSRLANLALRIVYNQTALITDGPRLLHVAPQPNAKLKDSTTRPGPPAALVLTFDTGVVLGNTTMCALFGVRGGGHGACCTASPFEVSAGERHHHRLHLAKMGA